MKKRNLGLFAIGTLAGGLAVPGAYALWTDADSANPGELSFGYDYLAAGIAGEELTSATWSGQSGTVEVPFWGPEQAQQLWDEGEIAIPIQVDAISQGNGTLSVTDNSATLIFGDLYENKPGILGNADVIETYLVEDPSQCVVHQETSAGWGYTRLFIDITTDDIAGAAGSQYEDRDYTFDAEQLGQGDEPLTKYLCFTARIDDGGDGVHENTVTVQGQGPGGTPVTATDTLTVEGVSLFDPADEPVYSITFTAEFQQCVWE